jgi:inosine triphosphate pyrophosphatase
MIDNLTLVTGNPHKLAEWQRILPPELKVGATEVDLDEIQSLDPEVIVADKARRAYKQLGQPVLVEDVSAGLTKLNGLPGPFIKFFNKQMGPDALYQLAGKAGEPAIVSCVIAYYDGSTSLTVRADVSGTVVPARGDTSFGFDCCFVVDGQDKTYGEMTEAEKDKVSHRAQAVRQMAEQLRQL